MTASATRTVPVPGARTAGADADGVPVPGAGPGITRPSERVGFRGPLRVHQLVLCELAGALLLCAWVVDPLLLAPASVLAGVLAVLALVRRRRRSLPALLRTVLAFRARVRAARVPGAADGHGAVPAPLSACEPGLRTYAFGGSERRPVGMIGDGTYLTAVLRVESDGTALRPGRSARPLPLELVRDALDVDGIRLESAQIVQHTRPAPSPRLPEDSVAARNYAALRQGSGAPAVRITWIALRLAPELCPEAVRARGGGLVGAQRCVVRAADQLAGRLSGAGLGATVLTEPELGAALTTSLGADPAVTARGARDGAAVRRTRETSRTWSCDGRPHTTYWVRRWPELGGGRAALPELVALLTSVPARATTFALTLAHGERQETALTGHVRVSGEDERELLAARHALERAARGARASLVRLDRDQLPGLLATVPLGGTR
ncbi:type VII secretion protein EccE [Streptomyces sp. NPDC001478]